MTTALHQQNGAAMTQDTRTCQIIHCMAVGHGYFEANRPNLANYEEILVERIRLWVVSLTPRETEDAYHKR